VLNLMVERGEEIVADRVGLSLPNMISLCRLLMVPLAIWLILRDRFGAAFWVFVVAGLSDALDGFIAKHFDRRTRLGALLDPIADKALLVSVFVTLGLAGQVWTSLVILVVFRDFLIVGGFLLIQAFAVPKRYDPLYISKINTGLQIALVSFVLGRLGLGIDAGAIDTGLSYAVIATTIFSGFSYIFRWARILASSEQAW
jgi:cardiolipin synthase (CMP-forming)